MSALEVTANGWGKEERDVAGLALTPTPPSLDSHCAENDAQMVRFRSMQTFPGTLRSKCYPFMLAT